MNPSDAFDRHVSEWLHADAEHRVPEHLDAVLRRTRTERQRPAWSSLERWLPVQSTLRFTPVPRIAWLLVLLGLIVSLAAAALWIGTRQRLPNPFGPARNGAIVMSHDGDIYALDRSTHAERLIVGGDGFDFSPVFSRDGTKLLFLRGSGGDANGLTVEVADPDGTAIRDVTPKVQGLDWLDWSPDGRQIVFLSRKTAQSAGLINVVNVDGSGLTTLDVGRSAHFVSWLPPLGREIVFRGEQHSTAEPPAGIWAVHPDGTGLRALATSPAADPNDYMTPAVAPDGSKVSYTSIVPQARVHILDLTTGRDAVLPSPDGITDQSGVAYFSPDGRFVGYVRSYADKSFQFVVAPVDGSGTGTPIGPRLADPRGDINWTFVPDGSAVIVDYGKDGMVQLLPVDGSPGSVLARGDLSFADIQRLAP
jgi:dipeptidyl aminopeptidase/acylaminoacyl peptidase